MAEETINHQTLVGYLLGTIPEADHLALAERFFADEELFERLLVAQADLVDQYVRGRLGPDEARRLESYLDRLPDGRHKIAVARALMEVAAEERPAVAAELEPNAWWRSMLLPANKPQPRLVYSLMAALIVLAIAVIWLVSNNRRLLQQNEKLFTQGEQHKTELQSLEQKIATEQRPSPEPPLLKPQPGSGSGKVETPPIIERRVPASTLVKLWLTPSIRGSSKPDELVLEPSATTVLLIAPVEGRETYNGYRARILATKGGGGVILEKQSSSTPRKNIEIPVEASQLPPATYKLSLELKTAAAAGIFHDYYFTIVKK